MPTEPSFDDPPSFGGLREEAAMQYAPADSSVPESRAVQVLRKHEPQLLRIDGVEGVGIGQSKVGGEAINIYIRDASVEKLLPHNLDGVPVHTEITGVIDALRRK
jgi:hypothetical protein